MPRSKSGGRLKTSTTPPQLFSQKDSAETEVKYFGLVRDEALSDLDSRAEALDEVLRDIQDPSEASTLGQFVAADISILEGVERFNLKREDFEILVGASIKSEDANGSSAALINPRQRISDRIAQAERFAGRGTVYQGQGTVLYKYYAPGNSYTHAAPPPFFTEAIDSAIENSADFIPSTSSQILNTHRIGYTQNGVFVPDVETEYWWSGEYNHTMNSVSEYGDQTQTALTNPKYPIVRDGNMKFELARPRGINTQYNWGLRFDAWMKRGDDVTNTIMRWAAQVNGHLRIDYYDKTGYDAGTGAVQGAWRTALNTFDPATHYTQVSRENPVSNAVRGRLYYVQGGPSTAVGAGDGTLPTQRALTSGGGWDLLRTHLDLEGKEIKNFGDDYVPLVIRFWYGQPTTDGASKPLGPAGFFIQNLSTNLAAANLSKWNDYSSQLRLVWNSTYGAWGVDTTAGGSAAGEANFTNFNQAFEVVGYTTVGAAGLSKPTALTGYITPSGVVIASKRAAADADGTTRSTFSISGISPTDGQAIWIVAKNRPMTVVPGTTTSLGSNSLWQRYLFNPSPANRYANRLDLLKNQGKNYVEPDPSKTPFEENLDLYKAILGSLPQINTYTSSRYDGMLQNSITTTNTQRDYDYNQAKLLMVGRQKKGAVADIGTTAPYSGKDLAIGETRKKGENYSYIEVIENAAGFGGNVILNAFPSNDLGVVDTASTSTYGKALHMLDNTKTFSASGRQNISQVVTNELPSDANFSSTLRLLYEEIDGQGRLVYGTWSGGTFTRDATGVIAALLMGASARNHVAKSAFLVGFTKGSSDYSFYGPIGAQKVSFSSTALTVEPIGTRIISPGIFPPGSDTTNNDQYIGSEIIFPGTIGSRFVTSYAASTGTVTFNGAAIDAGQYSCQVYYNHLQLGGSLPSNVVNSSGEKTSRTSIIPAPSGGNISDRLIQARYVFNSAYQFLRADSGAGLSFGETLFVNASPSPTESVPFSPDTELPAPPADIVTPFGYDNTAGAAQPGLGGLCYPPYSIQNIQLQRLAITDTNLYASEAGAFDVWWGGRIGGRSDLGERYLYVTDKLMFDFEPAQRLNILTPLSAAQKPVFTASTYTHKLEVELNVGLPTNSTNQYIYNDARFHSNNKPVKDKYFLFIQKASGGAGLSVLSANTPSWS